jgi:23S rRNA (cytidine2498-2'-O)-methyltransferase
MALSLAESRYLLFMDRRFRSMAKEEARSIFPGCRFESYGTQGAVSLILAITETAIPVDKINGSFIDFAVRVDAVLDNAKGDYGRIEGAIEEVLRKKGGRSFRIEVRNIESRIGESAKSIEVRLGTSLEKRGFRADVKGGDVVVYVVLVNDDVLVGHADARSGRSLPIDLLRQENAETGSAINRAEFKLREAIDFFGIDLDKVRTCLDIGAAPGGWTHYLSQRGVRVVARDTALLDYAKLAEGKRVLVLVDGPDVSKIRGQTKPLAHGCDITVADIDGPSAGFGDYDIVHLRAAMPQEKLMRVLGKFGKFDMLVIDANTQPVDSAKIADEMACLMKKGSPLVMTVKLVNPSFRRHVRSVREGLPRSYDSVRIKKLIHNRMELTAYAVSE